jgi:hypothetical protein
MAHLNDTTEGACSSSLAPYSVYPSMAASTSSLPEQVAHARRLIEVGEHPTQVAQLLKIAKSTLYAAL